MRIEQFVFLNEIVKHQSISVASEYCYTTPQNVSKSIRALEKELGVTLFKRTRQGIVLTPDGERILNAANIICHEVDKINEIYHPIRKDENADISSFSILSTHDFLPISKKLLMLLMKQHPQMRAALINAEPPFLSSSSEFIEFVDKKIRTHNVVFSMVDDYNLDSIATISNKYAIYSLFKEPLCIEVPKNSIWAKEKSIPVRALPNIPLISFGISQEDNLSFFHGAIERRYNLKLRPRIISNVSWGNEKNSFFREHFALLRTAYGWKDNEITTLLPLQEKCYIHHAVFLSHIHEENIVANECIMPFIRKQFSELYLLN